MSYHDVELVQYAVIRISVPAKIVHKAVARQRRYVERVHYAVTTLGGTYNCALFKRLYLFYL